MISFGAVAGGAAGFLYGTPRIPMRDLKDLWRNLQSNQQEKFENVRDEMFLKSDVREIRSILA